VELANANSRFQPPNMNIISSHVPILNFEFWRIGDDEIENARNVFLPPISRATGERTHRQRNLPD
jgi:hypothetical protein